MYGEQCARPGCAFAHGKMCRSGVACSTPGCSFVHAPTLKIPCKVCDREEKEESKGESRGGERGEEKKRDEERIVMSLKLTMF